MPSELTDIELDEVSLVDEPANQQAAVVIFKRHEPEGTAGTGLPTLLGKSRDLPTMTKVVKSVGRETGVVSFRKSATAPETVEILKEDYYGAQEMAGEEAEQGVTPILSSLHDVVQKILVAQASPEEKSAAITENFQQAMQLMGDELMGDEQEPGLLEKCLVTGAMIVKGFGTVETKTEEKVEVEKGNKGDQDKVSGADSVKVEKKDEGEMADTPEVADLRKQLAALTDKSRLEDIRKDLREKHIPLEHAETLLSLEKADKTAAEAMLKGLASLAAQVKHSSLTSELGASGSDVSKSAGAASADAKVAEIKKSNPNLTTAQAFAKALLEDKELAAAYDRGELN